MMSVSCPRSLRARCSLLSLLLCALVFPGVGVAAKTPAGAPRPALTVQTQAPQQAIWPILISAQGGLYAWQEAIIAAEVGGLRITELDADVGSVVKQGQVLAKLSQNTVQAALEQQRAAVAQAQAALAEAHANADRARKVKGTSAMSEQLINQYLIAEQSAQAALTAAQAGLRNEEIRLGQTSILAVDDGVITARNADLGQVVQMGGELFRMVRQWRIEWHAEVTAEQLARIQVGQKARIHVQGKTYEGTVRLLAPTLSDLTRKALVYVQLPVTAELRPGLFANGEIEIGNAPALLVPNSSLVLRDGNSYVFDVDAQHIAHQRKVQTGRMANDQVEIVSGLSPQAQVVLSGGAFLNDGDLVRVSDQAAAPATSAGAAP